MLFDRDHGLEIVQNAFWMDIDRSISKDELNCTIPAILDFPNFMRKKSIVSTVACIFLTLYLFIVLAMVCDDYLVTSMERLCYNMRLTYDVAGATFLAAATSAPELFVAFIGTFVTEGDIGVGTMIGSSVFNVLVIAGICGLFTGMTVDLDWWPLTRDTVWYLLAIIILTVVILDSKVTIFEAPVMLIIYVIYLITLFCDRRIQGLCRNVDTEAEIMDEDPMQREEEPLMSFKDHVCKPPEQGSSIIYKIYWVLKYPADFVLACTIVSVRAIYPLTMILAILWIVIISYFLAWFLTVIGYNLYIPDSIMGLTVLAAGTSVPEVVSSYIVTKKGYGSMAMCNAIGSNTFDILICLGLPWILSILIKQKDVVINSQGLTYTSGMLILTAIVLYITFIATKFRMGKVVGIVSLVGYAIFLIFSCGLEIYLKKEVCDIESEKYEFLTKE